MVTDSRSKNIKLTIEYDGGRYHGWQRQPNCLTIQEVLEEGIKKLTGENIILTASGRTDAGVHAMAQVANFHTQTSILPESIKRGLNSVLPRDITIIESSLVPEEFNARFSAKAKHYRYIVLNRSYRSSFKYRYSWLIPYRLDIDAMIRGTVYLKGEHDFSSFSASSSGVNNPVRRIDALSIYKDRDNVIFDIKGNGFLKYMVRNIVGTLVDVGRGRISYEDIRCILNARDRRRGGITAPSYGLFLVEVEY